MLSKQPCLEGVIHQNPCIPAKGTSKRGGAHVVQQVAQAIAHRARQDVQVHVAAVGAVLLHAPDDALPACVQR